MASIPIPKDVRAFIDGVLTDIGAQATTTAVDGLAIWLENEQGVNWTAFENNKGNPLGIQTAEAQAAGKSGDMAMGIKLTAQLLMSNYQTIVGALKTATSTTDIAQAIINSDWSGVSRAGKPNVYSARGLQGFLNPGTGTTGDVTGEAGGVNIPPTQTVARMKGVDVKNFHGFDLSAFQGSPDLGLAEQTIQRYVTDPGYKQKIDNLLKTEYGYSADWWKNIPEVNAVMLFAAINLDPSTAAGKNQFLGLLRDTNWWGTTNANQRAWEQAYGTNGAPGSDPAQAQQALQNAQEKVLADANQIGVTLNKQQLDAIALMYARNNYVQSGSFGAQSGTAQEWLDQAIINTIENIPNKPVVGLPTDFAGQPTGQSDFWSQAGQSNLWSSAPAGGGAPTASSPAVGGDTAANGLFGIAAQLYNDFQQVAQEYLMYNPDNAAASLLTPQQILQQVYSTLQNYTGSGSSFGSSNLINGAIASFTQTMRTQAAQIYPSMASAINQGITPQQYVQPYQSLIGQMMGIDPAGIDFTSPQWNWVVNTPSAKTGVKGALTLDQVQQKITQMPAWQNTNNAQQMSSDVLVSLNKAFGFGGN